MIGIMTFHRAINYGAVFQTFALQNVLESHGYETAVLDYRCKTIEEVYEPSIDWSHPKKGLQDILLYNTRKRKKEAFYDFIGQKLNLIPFEKAGMCDTLITGSDQVWNTEITGSDMSYFLCFASEEQKRLSYAACTGKADFKDTEIFQIKESLKHFSAISVRDDVTRKKMKDLYDGKIQKVIDPTLLLTTEEWIKLIRDTSYKNYILVFAVGFSERLCDFAQSLSEKKNKQIIFLNSNLRRKGKGIYLNSAGPEIALSLIAYADYIVTNSFHGTAMSIALRKEFFVELDHEKKGRNLRGEGLLADLGILGREIRKTAYNASDFIPIDWKITENNKKEKRETAICFLKKNL